jgi:hypothetical protein
MKLPMLLVGVLLMLTACGDRGSTDVTRAMILDTTTTTVNTTTTTAGTPSSTSSLAPGPVRDVDLVTYVAALEDALAGTAYEGEVLRSPEVFLATGALFCDQLESGLSPEEALSHYVEALTNGPVEQAMDDDLAMAGGVLGVGVVTLCPQYSDTLADSS